jgi:type II secretory pathway pseudopilin PulG
MELEVTRPRRPGESGLTLVEALISMTVLSLSLLSLAPLFTSSVRTNASASQLSNADTLARQKLEELSGYPRNDPRLAVADGANASASPGTATTGTGSVVSVNAFCDNDLPAWFNPATGQTSRAGSSPGIGWYAYPYSRTYTVEQFAQDMTTRVASPAAYFVKVVTVTVQSTRGPLPGIRRTTQTLCLRLSDES